MNVDRETLLVVLAVAALAPILADLSTRVRLPIIVVEIVLGIVVGPQGLGLAHVGPLLEVFAELGIAFLFLLAGMEIGVDQIRGRPAALAGRGWLLSLAVGLACSTALWAAGVHGAPVLVGLSLSTTALGALVPILRDGGLLTSGFGRHSLAAGAVGELGPIVLLSVVLAVLSGDPLRALLLFAFAAVAVATALFAVHASPPRVVRLVEATMDSSGQLAIRLVLLLLGGLFVLAGSLGLDVVLGAFTAGLIVGLLAHGDHAHDLHSKLDGIGYGFLIPIFFIATGMRFDLDALTASAATLALVPLFFALLLLVRGLPAMALYRRELPLRERMALAVLSASALPLIVAITEVATEDGRLARRDATALVGAGMVSLLVLPAVGLALVRRPAG